MFSLSGIWAKVIAAGAVVLAILAAVLRLVSVGRKQGRAEVRDEIRGKTDETRATWDKIDAGAPDLDGAIKRLRERAGHREGRMP